MINTCQINALFPLCEGTQFDKKTQHFTKTFLLQLTELCCLRDDLRQLMGIAQQLEPYIKSITSLMEQIQPEVGGQQQQPLTASEEQQNLIVAAAAAALQQSAGASNASTLQSKALNYSNDISQRQQPAAPPPANFSSLQQQQQQNQSAVAAVAAVAVQQQASSASPAPQLLPERIQTAVSLAEYKSR